jgi:putative thioredoxin
MDQVIGMTPPGAGAAGGENLIKDSNTEQFMADVIETSMQTPVIVDFWAPWCGPCKQLGPVLEKAVRAAKGAVRLVKINIDQNQELAAQMRIQSIPAVYAFYQGRPVDGFVGALPESQIKSFVSRLVRATGGAAAGPSPVEQALEQAKSALASGDTGTASALFGQVLAHEPQNAAAAAGLARCYISAGEIARAKEVLDRVPAEQANDAEVQAARSALELAEQASASSGALPDLRQRVAQNPNDHQARYDLAMALYAQGDRETAVDELLEIVRRDRGWNDEAARKQLLKLFEAFGPTDPLTLSARRRLSSILFS